MMRLERQAEEKKSAQPCGPCKNLSPSKNKGAGLERDVTSLISVLSKYLLAAEIPSGSTCPAE